MLKVIFWDFDGVLMNSNSIRDIGFEQVLSDYPKVHVDELLRYHRANGGLSRYVKFRFFFEKILGISISENEINQLADKFSVLMRQLLNDKSLIIEETMDFIRKNYLKYNMHITSGSDQNELRVICNKLNIDSYFISIHGSPKPKTEWIADLIEINNYEKDACLLIGDSFNDLEAANQNNIYFLAYNGDKSLMEKSNFSLNLTE